MSSENKDFYEKDVAEAIKKACDHFGVAQENLTIEVLETGSKGIFGLIRQKAHIRARIQEMEVDSAEKPRKKARKKPAESTVKHEKPAAAVKKEPPVVEQTEAPAEAKAEESGPEQKISLKEPEELPEESLEIVKDELARILELMDCPSTVTVENEGGTAHCRVSAEHEELLTSQDGRVLDSLQYLLRKIIAKKISGRIQLTIDVGNFREKRYQELKELAAGYSAQVKEDGKTQVIPSLNPSERRVVHVALQDDPDIRSRSVGDGLFKKVLIYKPGKGRKNSSRKRGRSRSRKKSDNGPKKEST